MPGRLRRAGHEAREQESGSQNPFKCQIGMVTCLQCQTPKVEMGAPEQAASETKHAPGLIDRPCLKEEDGRATEDL